MAQADPESPIHAIVTFCAILERLSLAYLIGGSFASSVHGDFRATNDIDFLVKISEADLEKFLKSLSPDFIFDDVAIRDAVRNSRSFNIIHERTFTKIDVFTRISAFQKTELERAEWIDATNTDLKVKVATAEDIILSKLCWFRQGNEVSSQQWRDIMGVIKVQGSRLDIDYLKIQAEHLGILSLLEKALGEAGS